MSSSVIRAHSSALFNCLQSVYWSKTKFSEFKPCIVQLAESLAGYSDFLVSQNKKMKEVHSSPVPVPPVIRLSFYFNY